MTLNLNCMNSQTGSIQALKKRQQQQLSPAASGSERARLQDLSILGSPSTSSSARKRHMTPTNTDTPLRRSEVGLYRDGARNVTTTTFNDDEEERRQARRRTILEGASVGDSSTFAESETLKKCLEIYNGNKLSRDNAWSLSLIDTLSTLLDRHHKSLNNFRVAGSSLEASSKVYGLRVDSVHTDVLRMSAGLNAQKFNDRQLHGDDDDDDDVATGGEGGADPNASARGTNEAENGEAQPASKPKHKRARKAVATVTKNKDTLNARLDTVPLQDPVFGKLNSIVGSINSSTRFMNNILLTNDSELLLRTSFRFWDPRPMEPECDYSVPPPPPAVGEEMSGGDGNEWASCERLLQQPRLAELKLRPLHTGYVISDTPEQIADDKDDLMRSRHNSMRGSFDADFGGGGGGEGDGLAELPMAFDINAECEPVPSLNEHAAMIDVEYADLEEMTIEDRLAVNNCRALRKAPVLIEDLRPVDASSKLEYSYRPLDKISQFWAGPSHWKFKGTRQRHSAVSALQGSNNATRRIANQRAARRGTNLLRKRSKQLRFEQELDEVFIKLDKYKARKANFQKKWDPRKLKLPTDFQLDADMFYKFQCAPWSVMDMPSQLQTDDEYGGGDDGMHDVDEHFGAHDADGGTGGGDGSRLDGGNADVSMGGDGLMNGSGIEVERMGLSHLGEAGDQLDNNTVLEIATSFDGAPNQVTKIIVPFAKRAKVIDMKNLKRCCTQLIHKQMKSPVPESAIPEHPFVHGEHFASGLASFKETYTHLPEILSPAMAEALSPSVAFYSVLHLANDYNLRLIPQEDLDDFKIRQLLDE